MARSMVVELYRRCSVRFGGGVGSGGCLGSADRGGSGVVIFWASSLSAVGVVEQARVVMTRNEKSATWAVA